MTVVQYTRSPVDSVARSRQVVHRVDLTILAIFLRRGGHLYRRPTYLDLISLGLPS
jgi:hypothetical protein